MTLKRSCAGIRICICSRLRYSRTEANVHGGYFEGLLSPAMIYRLACLGYSGTVAAFATRCAGKKRASKTDFACWCRQGCGRAGSVRPPRLAGSAATMRPMSRTIRRHRRHLDRRGPNLVGRCDRPRPARPSLRPALVMSAGGTAGPRSETAVVAARIYKGIAGQSARNGATRPRRLQPVAAAHVDQVVVAK